MKSGMSYPLTSFRKYLILTGNYGSGKTEIALNLALGFSGSGPARLVDLDIVNPYFRSAEKREMLEAAGILVLAPTFAMTTVDIPALPPEIQSVFELPCDHVVFDVGGDDTGAAALGRYHPSFMLHREETVHAFVVNCMRPLTQSKEDIAELAERIAERSRLKPDLLINNTNLGSETSPEMVENGERIVMESARLLGIQQVITAGVRDVLDRCRLQTPLLYIQRQMMPEWMEI